MAKSEEPITIKKYANRRLYNTGTSTYVTLEDLATMVKSGEDFVVYDAKTSEDITRSVLAQIIFEQENKEGQNLLPINFLRQLIRFYGDSMQMMVPRYLEVSLESFTKEQEKLRQQMAQAFGVGVGGANPFGSMEDQVRRNMEMFEKAFAMFTPFARRVLSATARIPYGAVATYGDVAADAGSPGGSRAAGNALGSNPVPIVIPCHRVVRSGGALGGYTGGVARKELLLGIERGRG